MSGRIKPLHGKRQPRKKAAGKKPCPNRQRELAAKKRKYKASGLYARRLLRKAEAAAKAETVQA